MLENEQLQEMISNGHARRMGHIENYFGIAQRQKLYKTFAVIAKFNTKVNDKALLFHALRPLLLKYPTLACTIVDTDYSDTTIPRPIHDFIKVIDVLKLKDFLYELPQEIKGLKQDDPELFAKLNEIVLPYADGNTLWKLAFLDDYTMVYITNHCLSDGISAKNLLQDLENEFERLSPDDDGEDYESKILLNYNSDKSILGKLPPSIDSIVSYKTPWWYIPEYIYNQFVINYLSFASGVVERSDTHIYKQVHIPPKDLEIIRQRLKDNEADRKITLTPFIQAAWLNAQYQAGIFNNFTQVSDVSLPCNTRQYLPSGYDLDAFKYGANTSGSRKFFTPVKKLTWSIVDYFNSYYKYLFKTKRFLYNMGIMTLEIVFKNQNMDKIISESYFGQPRGNTVFSNIGLVHDSNNKKYRISDVHFSQSPGSLVFTFAMNTVSSVDGGLNIVLAMAEKTISKEKFEFIVEKFKENLLRDDIEQN